MAPTKKQGYLIRRLVDSPVFQCPCGISMRPLSGIDGSPCSLHVTSIRESVRHYHQETTEVYYILEGVGKIDLNGQ